MRVSELVRVTPRVRVGVGSESWGELTLAATTFQHPSSVGCQRLPEGRLARDSFGCRSSF